MTHVSRNWNEIYFSADESEEMVDAIDSIRNYEEGIEPDDAIDSLAALLEKIGKPEARFFMPIRK